MEAKPANSKIRIGCAMIAAAMLTAGLVMTGLQWLGYLPSETALREGAELTVADVAIEGQQAVVRFKLTNRSKWALSAGVSCAVVDRRGKNVASQVVELLDVAPGQTVERAATFDLAELAQGGISQPMAEDVKLSRRWVCQAGRESSVLFH